MSSTSDKSFLNSVTAVVILAGGYSLRMGFPKLLLPFNESETFVEQIVKVYRQITNNIVLVINNEVHQKWLSFFNTRLSGVCIIPNLHPEYGRTHSIQLGLAKAKTNNVFIQNCDNPFVKKELLTEMLKAAPADGYVSPRVNKKGGHPVLLCGAAINAIMNAPDESTLKDILSKQKRIDYPTDDADILVNIDTAESYFMHFPEHRQKYFPDLNKIHHV
ncbi:MAG: nucleotidyltransferase family protein [Bacteroidia bacterium]|nr:nucleotidyltransferase family protein [Bacteroidia bacterium]